MSRCRLDLVRSCHLKANLLKKDDLASLGNKEVLSQGLSKRSDIFRPTLNEPYFLFPSLAQIRYALSAYSGKSHCFALNRICNCLQMKLKTATIAETFGLREFLIQNRDLSRRIFTWYFLHILFCL